MVCTWAYRPLLAKRRRKHNYIVEKAQKRVSGWKNRRLSQSGKEVLLKSVAQALPNFAMQVFLLPNHTISTLEKIFSLGGVPRFIG